MKKTLKDYNNLTCKEDRGFGKICNGVKKPIKIIHNLGIRYKCNKCGVIDTIGFNGEKITF